ncbi:MAG: M81 family metallopeptidase [Bdellovibrionota bacterium]
MRIALGGISQETNTFSTIKTTRDSFKVSYEFTPFSEEIQRLFDSENAEIIPTLFASAIPGGYVSKSDYLDLKSVLLSKLAKVGKIDAFILLVHGATEVEDIGHGETDLVKSIREVVGQDVLIGVTLDLHGNIDPEFVKHVNLVSALRTAPHVDYEEMKTRLFTNMIKCIKSGERPKTFIQHLPILFPGELVITADEPAKSLYDSLETYDQQDGISISSIMVGFAWADRPYAGVSIIISGTDEEVCKQSARELAQNFWDKRTKFCYSCDALSVEDSVELANSSEVFPFVISDSGDNLTAGASGESVEVLKVLLDKKVTNTIIAPLVNSSAYADILKAGEGSIVSISVVTSTSSFDFEAKVLEIFPDLSRALISCEGVQVVLCKNRDVIVGAAQFLEMGIIVEEKKIIVLKLGYLFPEAEAYAAGSVLALSNGVSTLNIESLGHTCLGRPIYPINKDAIFEI